MISHDFGRSDMHRADYLLLGAVLLVFLARLWLLLASPLEPGVDEAQYWVWSQNPGFGYYSKPPLIAWLIGLSHAVLGHHAYAIRLPALLVQTANILLIWQAGRLLFGAAAGRWAAFGWLLLPAVGMGSFFISTDTPLLFFWLLGLVCLINAMRPARSGGRWFFLAGLSLGMGMLAKYAAIWFLAGLVIWLVFDSRQGRGGLRRLGLFLAGLVLTASPTLIWNLGNQGQTVRHLSENANLGGAAGGLGALGDFLASQFLVFGPLFLLLALAGLISGRERLFLASFSLPVLVGISLQALLSEANANWAVTAAPALILAAGGLAASGWARFASLALLVNGGLAVLLFAVLATASLGPLPIASDPLRRLKGWQALASDITPYLDRYKVQTLLADRRDSASILSWYFHGRPLRIEVWDRDGVAGNHFELTARFGPDSKLPVLGLSGRGDGPNGGLADLPSEGTRAAVNWTGPVGQSDRAISARRTRLKYFFIATERGSGG